MSNFIERVTKVKRTVKRKPKKAAAPARVASIKKYIHETGTIRNHMTENQIDKTLKDTFPASDPPAWY